VKRLFTMLIVLSMAFTMAWAQNDLNLSFEDNSDLANWGHQDETNNYTTEAWDATAGVDGTGGLVFGDAGNDMRVLRAVTATAGAVYSLAIDIKVEGWPDGLVDPFIPIAISVRDLSSVAPMVYLMPDTATAGADFMHYRLTGVADAGTAGYIKIYGLNTVVPSVVTVDNMVFNDEVPGLFFSEYIEGSSDNKALEIYNPSGEEVVLSDYALANVSNAPTVIGEYEYWNSITEGATLAAGEVYVIGHGDAVAAIADVTDQSHNYLSNGDDGYALVFGTEDNFVVMDWLGDFDADPGSGWDVAGVTTATQNHTLIRKTEITVGSADWTGSAGTDVDNSEWIVKEEDYFGSIGSHPYVAPESVTFNVDMSFQITLGNFVPGTDVVDVAGDLNNWGGDRIDLLTDADTDGIYTGTFDAPLGAMGYKFRINSSWDSAESDPNRAYTVVEGLNVIDTVWFDDQEPTGTANVEVLLQVDMTVQLLNGNFDPGAGDLIVVRGGHDNFGNWGGAVGMTLDPNQTNVYTHFSAFDNVPVGSGYSYKFVILPGGDVDAPMWEDLGPDVNRSFVATGEEVDSDENSYGEIIQTVAYFSDVTAADVITSDVTVTFNVDITSVYRALAAGDTLIDTQTGSDDITLWSEVAGVNINGLLSQWWDWGNDPTSVGAYALTETADGSMIYTFSYLYTAGQAISQQYKYGINSLDNENGFGLNRTFDLDDTNLTMDLGMDCFGELNEDTNLPFPQLCGPMGPELFFSEYLEGSGNNKALEIYNPRAAIVDLSDYGVMNGDGDGGYYDPEPMIGSLAPGDVYTIVHPSFDFTLIDSAAVVDTLWGAYVNYFNGDDARFLVKLTSGTWGEEGVVFSIVDEIGYPLDDGYSAWDVAGVVGASAEHTLIRKAGINSGSTWSTSAGTDADNSEWIVFGQDFVGSLGSHPYVAPESVTFNVDMSFQITLGNFVPGTDVVDVAGDLNNWGGDRIDLLTDADTDGIYTGTFDAPLGAMGYKFRINSSWDSAESDPNRAYTVVEGLNVIDTVWFDDQEPTGTANVEVLLQVDMTVQLLNGNFDPGAGDLIVVRGGHDNFGNWGGAVGMTLDPNQTNVYTHFSAFDNVPVGSGYSYKFVILPGGDVDAPMWEDLGPDVNRSFVATGEEVDSDENSYGEIIQTVAYFSDVTAADVITSDVTVTFNVDITSVYRALAAGDTLIDTQTGSDDITLWSEVAGVNINGLLSQWWDWGNDPTSVGAYALTETADGSMIYTFSYLYTAGQAISQQYKYGINSLDNENGFGLNRTFDLDDTNLTMDLGMDCFGELNEDTNLPFPQECGPVSVDQLAGIPTSYALSQNYPNPFNPTTSINFDLPEANTVTLTIYNALGQEVRTLKHDYLNAGRYSVTWDGLDNAGNGITSGIYIYRMTSGNHSFSKKMLMLK